MRLWAFRVESVNESAEFMGRHRAFNPFHHLMNFLLRYLSLVALAAVLLCAGCGGGKWSFVAWRPMTLGYRDAKQLENQGRMDEALAAYLKVIARRGEDSAPESHLDAGQIYLGYLKDPIFAIYHFRKYLDLEPNSKQAQFVRGQIEAAKREFARTIPGQPSDTTSRVDMPDDGDSLRRENQELKSELTSIRVQQSTPATVTRSTSDISGTDQAPPAVSVPTGDDSSPIKLAPMDQPPVQAVTQADEPTVPVPVPNRPASKPVASGSFRLHTVAKGDTFYSLAQKYYGNRSRWKDIKAANPGETTLRIGSQIKIP